MKVDSQNDAIAILRRTLEHDVKAQILADIVEPLVKSFRTEITEIVRERLEPVTFERVDSFRDMLKLRDELDIHIKVEDK